MPKCSRRRRRWAWTLSAVVTRPGQPGVLLERGAGLEGEVAEGEAAGFGHARKLMQEGCG